MVQSILVKILLAPISLLYGFGVSLRDFFYRKGLLKGIEFNIPLISVGNLSIGGAGKTPHIEYLIRLLKDYIDIATVSRGYKRKTKGYISVKHAHNAEFVGDEPLQFKRKFPDIEVTVVEDRAFAIPKILMNNDQIKAVLLDDAFQHRNITPGLNILLTEYNFPFTKDYLLPSGRLREWRTAYKRADMIIVSKCPDTISEEDKASFEAEIKPLAYQQLYFSYYTYQNPYYLLNPKQRIVLDDSIDVLLICAIAGTSYLVDSLSKKVNSCRTLEYADHHYFSKFDLGNLFTTFNNIKSEKKVILTTEKDAMRLELHRQFIIENKLPIFILPIEVAFHFNDGERFNQDVKNFLLNFRV